MKVLSVLTTLLDRYRYPRSYSNNKGTFLAAAPPPTFTIYNNGIYPLENPVENKKQPKHFYFIKYNYLEPF